MTDPYELRAKVGLWLRTRIKHEDLASRYRHLIHPGDTPEQMIERFFWQLAADAEHSALLHRLLSGRDPLPEPPPLSHSYPVYPD